MLAAPMRSFSPTGAVLAREWFLVAILKRPCSTWPYANPYSTDSFTDDLNYVSIRFPTLTAKPTDMLALSTTLPSSTPFQPCG